MHTELRVRTVCELVCHEEHYLRPEVTAFCGGFVDDSKQRGRLHAMSANFDNPRLPPSRSHESRLLEYEIFKLDCIDTTKNGTYCNMWHLYALSSVLRHPIRSIYPDYNHYIRPLLNKEVSSRDGVSPIVQIKSLYIMWTRASPMDGRSWWSPNHFVPCIQTTAEKSNTSGVPMQSGTRGNAKSYAHVVAGSLEQPTTKHDVLQYSLQAASTVNIANTTSGDTEQPSLKHLVPCINVTGSRATTTCSKPQLQHTQDVDTNHPPQKHLIQTKPSMPISTSSVTSSTSMNIQSITLSTKCPPTASFLLTHKAKTQSSSQVKSYNIQQ